MLVQFFRSNKISGWRRHQSAVFGSPDFIFRKEQLAVFVDGCFWHNCPLHGTLPASNADFWAKKLKRNQARDSLVNRTLKAQGWRVLRLWQHDLKTQNEQFCIAKITKALDHSDLNRK
jgi:DNA mismatch endonuclease, patch repair protein